MKHMFEANQILPCKVVVFIKSDHKVVLSHLRDLITMWSLYTGGLYKKVVTKQGFHSRVHLYYDDLTIFVFHFHFPFPVSSSTVSNCPTEINYFCCGNSLGVGYLPFQI